MGKGARARSSADVAVFTIAALPMKPVGRMESAEDFGVAVNVDDSIRPDGSAAQRQESRRINIAQMGHEDDAMAIANLKALIHRGLLDFPGSHPGGTHPIKSDAAVRWCLRSLDRERCLGNQIEHPIHDALALLCRNFIEGFASAYGDQ